MKPMLYLLAALLIVSGSASLAETLKARSAALGVRKDNGDYDRAAYSFREGTADAAVHRNYVDLLLNKCGSLHVRTAGGQENRICDLGEANLADAPDAAPAGTVWRTEYVRPQAGHVYLEEIKQNGRTMTVKFVVDEVTADGVKLTWVTVKPLEGQDDAGRGAAGTMGQCGGPHAQDK